MHDNFAYLNDRKYTVYFILISEIECAVKVEGVDWGVVEGAVEGTVEGEGALKDVLKAEGTVELANQGECEKDGRDPFGRSFGYSW